MGIISGRGKQTATPLSCGRNLIKFYDTKFAKRGFKKSTQHLISGEYSTENEQYAKNRRKKIDKKFAIKILAPAVFL